MVALKHSAFRYRQFKSAPPLWSMESEKIQQDEESETHPSLSFQEGQATGATEPT
jgi:hypothetical protein